MALKPCPECGKEVSTEADKCPNCGVTIKAPVKSGAGCLAWTFRLLSAGWIALGLVSCVGVMNKEGRDDTAGGMTLMLTFFIFFIPGLIGLAIGEILARKNR